MNFVATYMYFPCADGDLAVMFATTPFVLHQIEPIYVDKCHVGELCNLPRVAHRICKIKVHARYTIFESSTTNL